MNYFGSSAGSSGPGVVVGLGSNKALLQAISFRQVVWTLLRQSWAVVRMLATTLTLFLLFIPCWFNSEVHWALLLHAAKWCFNWEFVSRSIMKNTLIIIINDFCQLGCVQVTACSYPETIIQCFFIWHYLKSRGETMGTADTEDTCCTLTQHGEDPKKLRLNWLAKPGSYMLHE